MRPPALVLYQYPYVLVPGLWPASDQDADAHWKVVVNNTFLDVVCDAKPTLTHTSSAPGKLISSYSASVEPSFASVPEANESSAPGGRDSTSSNSTTTTDDVQTLVSSGIGCTGIEHLDSALLQDIESADATNHGRSSSRQEKIGIPSPERNSAESKEEPVLGPDAETCQKRTKKKKPTKSMRAQKESKVPTRIEEVPDEEESQEAKKLSPTAKRNQRRRAQAAMFKTAALDKGNSNDTKDGSTGKSTASISKVETLPPSATAWEGTNPSVERRAYLKAECMGMFCANRLARNTSCKLMTPQELAKFNSTSGRPMVSVHGDVFDVSSNICEYGPGGSLSFEAGTDVTWAVVSSAHTKENCNLLVDIFKADDDNTLAGRLLPLCRTIVDFEQTYGQPVGRLTVFAQEEKLPPPPTQPMDCVVQ